MVARSTYATYNLNARLCTNPLSQPFGYAAQQQQQPQRGTTKKNHLQQPHMIFL